MSNMDEVEEKLRSFILALQDFQESLSASVIDLQRCHESLDHLWRDEARRQYDQRFASLLDLLVHYSHVQGPGYIALLSDRHLSLLQYLRGN
jgi:hypothetical protein